MQPRPYAQAFCGSCGIAIGFRGQGPAYAAGDMWLCGKHVDRELRQLADHGSGRANPRRISSRMV